MYPHVPTDPIIDLLQKETLSVDLLKVLFPFLKGYEVHVPRRVLLAALRACQEHRDHELLRQLEWECASLGAMAPIEELLQMLVEPADHLYPYYENFFTQVGHMLDTIPIIV